MNTIAILYTVPVSIIFDQMKVNSIYRNPIDTLSDSNQTFYNGEHFSFVYTGKGETLIIIDNSNPKVFQKGCKQFYRLIKKCKLPFHFLDNEETQIVDHRGFAHSIQLIKDQI